METDFGGLFFAEAQRGIGGGRCRREQSMESKTDEPASPARGQRKGRLEDSDGGSSTPEISSHLNIHMELSREGIEAKGRFIRREFSG